MKKILMSVLLGTVALSGCDPAPPTPITPPTAGVFILSEGQYGAGDGVVSAFDKTTKTLLVDAFGAANGGSRLGDVVQDLGVVGSRGYVCVNASKKVEVVSLPDFKSVATIKKQGKVEPGEVRFFTAGPAGASGPGAAATRGYVTAWRGKFNFGYDAGRVLVLDLATNTIIDSITVGRCPERATILAGNLYVPNSLDNTVSVIDLTNNRVTGTIVVGDGPTAVVAEPSGRLWVLCAGFIVYSPSGNVLSSTPGALVRFGAGSAGAVQQRLSFATAGPGNLRLSPDGTQLYYGYGGAQYRVATTATALPTTPFIRRDFSGFAIDPRDQTIFAAIAPSFSTNGRFLRYPPNGGTALDSFTVRVGPNGFVFY